VRGDALLLEVARVTAETEVSTAGNR